MLKVLGAVVAALMAPALAFGQGGLAANALPSGAAPHPQSTRFEAPPRPTLAPTRKIDPTYPDKARRAGVQGDVWLDVIVLADGTVKSVMVAKSLDTVFGLDQAAIAAVRQWQYPPLSDGRASRPPLQIVVPFRLPDAPPAVARVTVEEFGNSAFRPTPNDPRVVPPKLLQQVPPVYTKLVSERGSLAASRLTRSCCLMERWSSASGQVSRQGHRIGRPGLGRRTRMDVQARDARRQARADDCGHCADVQPPLVKGSARTESSHSRGRCHHRG